MVMDVVSGLLVNHDGCVLMGKRKPSKLRPSLWELPGGKIEHGEEPGAALRREWREELGVEAKLVGRGFPIADTHIVLEVPIRVRLFEVESHGVISDHPDHDDMLWTTPEHAVMRLPCSPGFYLQYAELRSYLIITKRWRT